SAHEGRGARREREERGGAAAAKDGEPRARPADDDPDQGEGVALLPGLADLPARHVTKDRADRGADEGDETRQRQDHRDHGHAVGRPALSDRSVAAARVSLRRWRVATRVLRLATRIRGWRRWGRRHRAGWRWCCARWGQRAARWYDGRRWLRWRWWRRRGRRLWCLLSLGCLLWPVLFGRRARRTVGRRWPGHCRTPSSPVPWLSTTAPR